MWNEGTLGREFWEHLTRVDLARAEQVRAGGCDECGGPLDRADYPRKPRGELGETARHSTRRVSFCCRRQHAERAAAALGALAPDGLGAADAAFVGAALHRPP